MLLVCFQDFAEVFQALFAVFVQVLYKLLLLDNLWHVLTKCQLGACVLRQTVVALYDVLEQARAHLVVLDLRDHHVV